MYSYYKGVASVNDVALSAYWIVPQQLGHTTGGKRYDK